MAHSTRDKPKLLLRVRRIRGQIDAIGRAVESERYFAQVLIR
jgi:DNA-binding FrmR family transcriptional regulator